MGVLSHPEVDKELPSRRPRGSSRSASPSALRAPTRSAAGPGGFCRRTGLVQSCPGLGAWGSLWVSVTTFSVRVERSGRQGL